MSERNVEALREVEQLGKIVFRAVNSKKQQPVKIGPLQDRTGRLYTGQGAAGYYEMLSINEKQSLTIPVFDHTTVYTVEDGKVLNIDTDPVDAALWKWIQLHPYIAATREETFSNRDAVFYIDNPQKTAESYVGRDKKITKVKTLIYNATREQKVIVAKAMSLTGAEGMSETQLEEWLVLKTEEIPDTVGKFFDAKNADLTNATGILKELVTYGIVKRFGTVFKYGGREGISLGTSEDLASQWIANTENEENVFAIMSELEERKA